MKPTEVRFLLGHQHTVPLLKRAGAFVPSAKDALARGLAITDDAGTAETEYCHDVLTRLTSEASVYPWRMPVGMGREFSYDACMMQFNKEMWQVDKFGLLIHVHANATVKGKGDYRGVYYDSRSHYGESAAEAAVKAVVGGAIRTQAFSCSETENDRAFSCINGAYVLPNVTALLVELCFLDNPDHYWPARSQEGMEATAKWLVQVANAAVAALQEMK